MLTEKSITQQLRFHKLPFPEDLVGGGGAVSNDGAGGNLCFVPESGLPVMRRACFQLSWLEAHGKGFLGNKMGETLGIITIRCHPAIPLGKLPAGGIAESFWL